MEPTRMPTGAGELPEGGCLPVKRPRRASRRSRKTLALPVPDRPLNTKCRGEVPDESSGRIRRCAGGMEGMAALSAISNKKACRDVIS